ncbi:SH3 domain-containing protein [Nocardioides dongkuii]|nr:SH3 domain-containing protein [Nocardioides dongkuii]
MPRASVVAGPLAVLATASVVTLGVLTQGPTSTIVSATDGAASIGATAGATEAAVPPRQPVLSRGGARVIKPLSPVEKVMATPAVLEAVRQADTTLWATETLNLWSAPNAQADQVGQLEEGKKVLVTGRSLLGRVEVVVDDKARWVSAGYLVEEKPKPEAEPEAETEAGGGTEVAAAASCTNGTSVPSGVSPNIVKVHEAVCAAFPEIATYGTFRSDGEHGQGLAVDIMVSGERGWEVAEFVRERYSDLGVSYLIYAQKIWSVERSGEGWRGMEDRGSTTANHYDHVHVTTY